MPGSGSVTTTSAVVSPIETLLTPIVNVKDRPCDTESVWDLVIRRSGTDCDEFWISTGIVEVLLTGVMSPPPDTAAVLVRSADTPCATSPRRVMGRYEAPAASESARLHETFGTLTVHAQPFTVPVGPVGVRPAGSVSVTVTVPCVAPAPLLVTVNVKVPDSPRPNGVGWTFAMVRSAPTIGVVTDAVAPSGSPPPERFAVLVMLVAVVVAETVTFRTIVNDRPAAMGPGRVQLTGLLTGQDQPAGAVTPSTSAPPEARR